MPNRGRTLSRRSMLAGCGLAGAVASSWLGCGSFGSDPPSVAPDASSDAPEQRDVDAAAPPDAPDLPPVVDGGCKPLSAFASVAEVALARGDGNAGVYTPFVTADEKTIVYTEVTAAGGNQLMIADRSGPPGTFGAPRRIMVQGSPADGLSPWISDDLTTLTFSAAIQSPRVRVHRATRATPNDSFGAPAVAVDDPDSTAHLYDARPVPGDGGIAFRRDLTPNAAGVVERSLRVLASSAPAQLLDAPEANVGYAHPSFAATGVLYISRAKLGETDYEIVRGVANADGRYGAFFPIPGFNVNTLVEESPGWVSPDECVLYFERKVGAGLAYRIYRAERAR